MEMDTHKLLKSTICTGATVRLLLCQSEDISSIIQYILNTVSCLFDNLQMSTLLLPRLLLL